MKILLLNDYGSATGGAEYQILSLRDGLRSRGHDARLFASSALYSPGEPAADYYCRGSVSWSQSLLMVANCSAFHQLRRVLASFRPDVVHLGMFSWQLSPLILSLVGRFPCVHHVQMYNLVCPLGTKMTPDGKLCLRPSGRACLASGCLTPQSWALRMTQKALCERWRGSIDSIVAVSEAVRRRLKDDGVPVQGVIWNGVPVTTSPRVLSATPTAVFAGRLVPEKGVDILLRAFALVGREIPSARLWIAGEGTERPRLERLIEELNLRGSVSMLGFLSRDKIERTFGEAWVQIVPGRWEEPFGMVIAEAMMRGSAVVASALGGALDLVEDNVTGRLVLPGDVAALADALRAVLSDPDAALRLGQAGRARAMRDLTEDKVVDQFVALYENLLQPSSTGAAV